MGLVGVRPGRGLKICLGRLGTMPRSREGQLRSFVCVKSTMTVTILVPVGIMMPHDLVNANDATPSKRFECLMSVRRSSPERVVLGVLRDTARAPAMRATVISWTTKSASAQRTSAQKLRASISCLTLVFTPHVSTRLASVVACAYVQDGETSPWGS